MDDICASYFACIKMCQTEVIYSVEQKQRGVFLNQVDPGVANEEEKRPQQADRWAIAKDVGSKAEAKKFRIERL